MFKIKFIDFENKHILLPAEIVKTNDDWLINDIPKVFWNIVKPDSIIDIPSADQIMEIRRIWNKKAKRNYPANALRHSFATYHLSLHRNAPRTSLVMRHRNPNQLWQSYLAKLVSEKEAVKWFIHA